MKTSLAVVLAAPGQKSLAVARGVIGYRISYYATPGRVDREPMPVIAFFGSNLEEGDVGHLWKRIHFRKALTFPLIVYGFLQITPAQNDHVFFWLYAHYSRQYLESFSVVAHRTVPLHRPMTPGRNA